MAEPRRGRITPMWLAHHYPDDYERCVVIGRSHVCRRCLVLYPVALAVMVLTGGLHPAAAIDALVLIGLPLPAVIELVLEQAGVLHYDARRQIAVTVLLALGLGRGFALYLQDHGSLLFWVVVLTYSAITGGAVALRHWRDAHAADPA
jgi:hypothetical protein